MGTVPTEVQGPVVCLRTPDEQGGMQVKATVWLDAERGVGCDRDDLMAEWERDGIEGRPAVGRLYPRDAARFLEELPHVYRDQPLIAELFPSVDAAQPFAQEPVSETRSAVQLFGEMVDGYMHSRLTHDDYVGRLDELQTWVRDEQDDFTSFLKAVEDAAAGRDDERARWALDYVARARSAAVSSDGEFAEAFEKLREYAATRDVYVAGSALQHVECAVEGRTTLDDDTQAASDWLSAGGAR